MSTLSAMSQSLSGSWDDLCNTGLKF